MLVGGVAASEGPGLPRNLPSRGVPFDVTDGWPPVTIARAQQRAADLSGAPCEQA